MNQSQGYISTTALLAVTAWGAAGLLLAVAWGLVLIPGDGPPGFVAASAGSAVVATGIAMLAQIRIYTIRVCSLIRATAGLEREELRAVK